MKASDSILKRCLVLSVTIIYLVVAFTYLLYLPKYSPLRAATFYSRMRTQLVVNPAKHVRGNTANMVVLLHQAYRSAINSKRRTSDVLSKISLIIVSIIFGVGSFRILSGKIHLHDKNFRYSYRYVYLSCRTLRI